MFYSQEQCLIPVTSKLILLCDSDVQVGQVMCKYMQEHAVANF
jgi:hypothetical protein